MEYDNAEKEGRFEFEIKKKKKKKNRRKRYVLVQQSEINMIIV